MSEHIDHIDVDSGDVLVAVGTMKGAWLFAGDPGRGEWRSSGLGCSLTCSTKSLA